MGLANGNLNCVADAVGRSGAGLKSRLAILQKQYEQGQFPQAEALFEESVNEAKESKGEKGAEEEAEE